MACKAFLAMPQSFLSFNNWACKKLSSLSLPQHPKIQHLAPFLNNDLQVTKSYASSSLAFPDIPELD